MLFGESHNLAERYAVYQRHPNPELNRLFSERPFQGAAPEAARFLFVGLDANYAEDIDQQSIFPALLDYHQDGVQFWKTRGVHHPFLLPAYRGDGRRYHLNFARIGFTPDDSHQISFVELLHLPTVGRSKLEPSDLDTSHLEWLGGLLSSGVNRHVFVSPGILRLMAASGKFPWLRFPAASPDVLPVLHSNGETTLYRHLHFSNYGKFQAQMDMEAAAILRLARRC